MLAMPWWAWADQLAKAPSLGKNRAPSPSSISACARSRNKRKRTGKPSHLMAEVLFDPDHARLRDSDAS
jgi:hypothetical protein